MLLAWVTGQAGGGGVDVTTVIAVITAIGGLGGLGGLAALLQLRKQGQQLDATTEKIEADAAQVLGDATASFAKLYKDSVEDVERMMSDLRQKAREALAERDAAIARETKAIAERAELQATRAKEQAEAADQRHDLQGQLGAERLAHQATQVRHDSEMRRRELAHMAEIEALKARIEELEDTLARHGLLDRRRSERAERRGDDTEPQS